MRYIKTLLAARTMPARNGTSSSISPSCGRPTTVPVSPCGGGSTARRGLMAVVSESGAPAPYYTLDGRRVSPQHLRPGVYIRGGKKVVVRD